LAAVEAKDRELDVAATLDLLRQMEVVMAGVSVLHEPVHGAHWPRAHGADVVGPRLRGTGVLDVGELSAPGPGYVKAEGGYWGPYAGSEYLLGVTTSGPAPAPGPRPTL
jgi:hypothetical protein